MKKNNTALAIADPLGTSAGVISDDPDAPYRCNIVVTYDATRADYVASPRVIVIPPGYGIGADAYLKWYVIPKPGDEAKFAVNAIVFDDLNLNIDYNPTGQTASVPWRNAQTGAARRFRYNIFLDVRNESGHDPFHPVSVDPDVENQAPPG